MNRASFLRAAATVAVAAAVLAAAGCNRFIDPTTVLAPADVVTGWYDAGIMPDGKNKLVPSVSLRFTNTSNEPVGSVQVNAIFRRVGEQEMWGEHYGWAIHGEDLAPGAKTDTIVLQSALGYTGVQPRMQMLQNSNFIDAKVEIFLKQGSRAWAKLAEFPIDRQLLTR
ncbi:MAG: hypothetical protein AB7H88_18025 [Vicinamibacterales bacterium]